MSSTSRSSTQRGRNARTPWRLGWAGMWDVGWRIMQRVGQDRLALVAAGIAFFSLLAVFPGLAALVGIAGLISDPETVVTQLNEVTAAMPAAARDILMGQVREVAGGPETGLNLAVFAGLALALYSASRGVANLMAGLNVVYGEEEKRGFVTVTGVTLALTLFLLIMLVVALAIVAVIPAVLAFLGDRPGLQAAAELARWPILLLVGAGCFVVLYRFGPSRRAARWRWLAPGGLAACLFWIAATAGFAWYVETLGSYTETFGALAGVIVLMLWLWISAFVVLLGALIDAEMEGQTAVDSTTGTDRPMGKRGAVKADRCDAGVTEIDP